MGNPEEHRKRDCIACRAKCCRHVATGIDTPTCKRDYDNIRWYLMHEDVNVFVDKEGEWTIEFFTKCLLLKETQLCDGYGDRPRVCRDYPDASSLCEYEDDALPYKALFTTAREFEQYLESRNIDWRWKKLPE